MSERTSEEMAKVVEQAVAGDRDAFGVIYEEYFTPVYRFIFYRVKNREEADDLTQEVFTKALGAFSRYEAKRENPLPYLYTIARNAVIDKQKQRKNVEIDDEMFMNLPDDSARTDKTAMLGEEIEALRSALSMLPEEQRQAIELRFMSEMTGTEVARTMGKSEEAVRQLQSRGLRALRERFKETYGT